MAQIIHNTIPHGSGSGDPLATAMEHQNSMNTELYNNKVNEIGGKGLSDTNFSQAEKDKLAALNIFAQPQVQSDMAVTNPASLAYVANQPPMNTDSIANNSLVVGATTSDALNNLLAVSGAVSIAKNVWVEVNGNDSIGLAGRIDKPFLTINAALDALPSDGGIVRIGIGSFSSPLSAKIKANTYFIGTKEPVINSTITISAPNTRPIISAPTALVDGTVLTGEFSALDKTNVSVEKLGIDVGKTWIDTFNGGVTVGGLVIASTSATAPVKNIYVSNVTVLGYSAPTAQHCMLFENIIDSKFENLTTYYHIHGVAIKGINLIINGVNGHSHGNDALIIKSDTYAPTRDVDVSNVNITSLTGYEGGGLILEEGVSGSSLLERVSISNINMKYVGFGFKNVNKVSNINITNFNLYDSNSFGVQLDNNVDNINLSGLNITKTASHAFDISISGTESVNIINSNISNATGTGYKLTTAGSSVINLVNSNTLNTTASYVISGTGVFGSSNFGTGTLTGYINFKNPFIKSSGRIFSTNDGAFGDLASTSGSLDLNFSNSSQKGVIESYNFTTALRKPLEIKSLTILFSALTGTGTRQVVADTSGNLIATDLASTSARYTPTGTIGTNVTAVSVAQAMYNRVGNMVSVRALVASTHTAGSTVSTYTITLPINRATATAIGIGFGVSLVSQSTITSSPTISSSATTTATVTLTTTLTGSISTWLDFSYLITD